jgi:hypothetical protein
MRKLLLVLGLTLFASISANATVLDSREWIGGQPCYSKKITFWSNDLGLEYNMLGSYRSTMIGIDKVEMLAFQQPDIRFYTFNFDTVEHAEEMLRVDMQVTNAYVTANINDGKPTYDGMQSYFMACNLVDR